MGATIVALLTGSAAVARPDQGQNRNNGQQQQGRQQHDGRQWHEQSGRWDNGRHRGWGRERGRKHLWSRGEQMGYNDWNTAQRVDYRRYHLRQPPRGYEWRRSNDRFVLVAVVSGVILSVILFGGR
jgi:Ni/Co efflux regulator RcnB